MLTKLQKPAPDRDQVVILESSGIADIATVIDEDNDRVYAVSESQDYSIPIGDLRAYVGSRGKIYHIGADTDYIADTKRLAALEKSTVLQQITNFKSMPLDDDKSGISVRDILTYALVGILLLAVVFK